VGGAGFAAIPLSGIMQPMLDRKRQTDTVNLEVILKNLLNRFHEENIDFVLCGCLAQGHNGYESY